MVPKIGNILKKASNKKFFSIEFRAKKSAKVYVYLPPGMELVAQKVKRFKY